MPSIRLVWSGMIALVAALAATQARAQQDLDAGKTGSQLFAQDCAACHRSPQALKSMSPGALVGFLRQHYTSSSNSANIVAAYVLSAGHNPRAERQKGRPGEEPSAQAPRERSKLARPAEPAASQPSASPAAGPRQSDRLARPADPAVEPHSRPLRRPRRQPPAEPAAAPPAEPASAPAAETTSIAAPPAFPPTAGAESSQQSAAVQSAFSDPLP